MNNSNLTWRQKAMLGAAGGLTPLILNLAVVDFEAVFGAFDIPAFIGYAVRVFGVLWSGAFVAALHKSEDRPFLLFELGMIAPALLMAVSNGVNAGKGSPIGSSYGTSPLNTEILATTPVTQEELTIRWASNHQGRQLSTIVVRVLDPNGERIPHAEVLMSRMPDQIRFSVTPFETFSIEPGDYSIDVRATGYEPARVLLAGIERRSVDVVLEPLTFSQDSAVAAIEDFPIDRVSALSKFWRGLFARRMAPVTYYVAAGTFLTASDATTVAAEINAVYGGRLAPTVLERQLANGSEFVIMVLTGLSQPEAIVWSTEMESRLPFLETSVAEMPRVTRICEVLPNLCWDRYGPDTHSVDGTVLVDNEQIDTIDEAYRLARAANSDAFMYQDFKSFGQAKQNLVLFRGQLRNGCRGCTAGITYTYVLNSFGRMHMEL